MLAAISEPTHTVSIDRPSRAALNRGLERVLAAEIAVHGPLHIAHRRENPLVSTYVADIVQVRFADDHREQLLCKFAHGRELTAPTPHRGLAHEARVYAEVLANCPLDSPRVHGGFLDDETGDCVLVMTYYPEAVPAGKSTDPAAMQSLIRWLASFHEWGLPRSSDPRWAFLPRFATDDYTMWLDRTCELARPFAADHPWLETVAARYRSLIPTLVRAPVTLVHGEFTTRNALWSHGRILPIDWETAAIGPAELDLAVFTYDWHPEDLRDIERMYVEARWGGDAPDGFHETMLGARLYAAFHWLFGTPAGVGEERIRGHLATLRAEAVRWGVIPA